jgi:hypothetical protein
MKKIVLAIFILIMSSKLFCQDTTGITYVEINENFSVDTSNYNKSFSIDLDRDDVSDIEIDFSYINIADTIVIDDSLYNVSLEEEHTFIETKDGELAFYLSDTPSVSMSKSDIIEYFSDSGKTYTNDDNWNEDYASSYTLTLGQYYNSSLYGTLKRGLYEKGVCYILFKIWKDSVDNNNEGWIYGWIRLNHYKNKLQIIDLAYRNTVNKKIFTGQIIDTK